MKKLKNLEDGFPFAINKGTRVAIYVKVGHFAGDYKVRKFNLYAETYGDGIGVRLGEEEVFKADLKVTLVDFEPKSKRIQQWL